MEWILGINSRMKLLSLEAFLLLAAVGLDYSDGAACNDEQVAKCLSAAQNGQLSSLASGGKCQNKPYVEFSHLCSVHNYLPTVDHCCCAYEESVFCCRYHQNWNHFRCAEAKDIIGESGAGGLAVPWYILVPVVLGSLLLLAVVGVCCLKRWCFRREDDSETKWCGLFKQKDSKSHRQQSSSGANNASQSSLDNKDSSARLLPNSSQGSIMPTAPPLSEADMVMFRQLSNQSCTGNTCAYFRLDSETPSQGMAADSSDVALASGAGNVCPNCSAPPPTYDESREHQLLS